MAVAAGIGMSPSETVVDTRRVGSPAPAKFIDGPSPATILYWYSDRHPKTSAGAQEVMVSLVVT